MVPVSFIGLCTIFSFFHWNIIPLQCCDTILNVFKRPSVILGDEYDLSVTKHVLDLVLGRLSYWVIILRLD